MMQMLQSLLAQQGIQTNKINTHPTTSEELLAHQEPLAASLKSLIKLLEYEKGLLPDNVFIPLLESFQKNFNNSVEKLKVPTLPPMDSVVSVNGEPVKEETNEISD
jgi:hypothetical protein